MVNWWGIAAFREMLVQFKRHLDAATFSIDAQFAHFGRVTV